MALILVTGGARSGKSDYAQALAEETAPSRLFVATCPPPADDDEMAARVAAHREKRRGRGWRTLEEPLDPGAALAGGGEGVALVDCLTLWVSNLMAARPELDEAAVARLGAEFAAGCRRFPGTVVCVTNEVGAATVPEHPLTRRFRDLVGRLNQAVASEADRVVLVVCGQPLIIKDGIPNSAR